MIVYNSTKQEFREDVRNNQIEEKVLKAHQRYLGKSVRQAEIRSWKNSLPYMSSLLEDDGIPDNSGIAIEYNIPFGNKRIDFIVTGINEENQKSVVIVELKQWETASLTDKDGIVKTYVGKPDNEVIHPSRQAWTYAALLRDYNEVVQVQRISLHPCAYLHNMVSETEIKNSHYKTDIDKAPVFIRNDVQKLTEFIKRFIKHGDDGKLIYEIDKGKIRPSKNLADTLLSMLDGNQEFILIDDQKVVYETALDFAAKSTVKDKHVLIVEGGPGTGKSVVAINLLVELTNRRLVSQYVTKNAAPRAVYESVLTGSFTKSHISNLFKGSGSYTSCDPNIFDSLIVDEAHRLNAKSGMFQNLGENQIKEIIHSSKSSVFFIDEDQRVTWKDIGSKEEIIKWAKELGATTCEMELPSQFRCNGSDGYIAWLNNILQIQETANHLMDSVNYDFQVFDSPNELREAINRKNSINNKSRLVAGYCWDWVSKKPENKALNDIVIDEHDFSMQWNLQTYGSLWIRKPESINEIGCIHTCQGLEVDYIGVILGPDIVYRDGGMVVRPDRRAKTDQSLKGYKKALKENPEEANKKAEAIIKNTYRTLMTRGQKGCYVFSTDPETNAYFAELAKENIDYRVSQEDSSENIKLVDFGDKIRSRYHNLDLEILDIDKVIRFENSVPIYDLQIAAGQFEETEIINNCDWVKLPDYFRPSEGMFVAQVVGESMNKKIPNGKWCLFRKNPAGSRDGKIVLVQHQDIQDQDTESSFTIKMYKSEKTFSDEQWEHNRIILSPLSYDEKYSDIVIDESHEGELRVIGEFIAEL
jgi:hypothetical protein